MALFTDPGIITLDDLLAYESSLTQVATVHNIDIPTKIKIATDQVGDKILLYLLRAGQFNPNPNFGISVGLQSVIVTPALKRWLCYEALSRVFAEAYNVQLNTRFQGKLQEYQKESDNAASLLGAVGLQIVSRPLPKPALPIITVGSGGIGAPAIFVQTAWVDSLGRESAPSEISGSVLNGFASVQAQISPDSSTTPSWAVGWNLYASLTQQGLALQTSVPLGTGLSWQMSSSGLVSGTQPSGGQKADYVVLLSNRVLRG